MLENLVHTKLDPNLKDVGYLTKTGKKSIGVTGEVMLVDDSGNPIGGLESGGAGSVGSTYIAKPANGDITTAYTAATQITLSGYPAGLSAVYDEDIEFVRQINSAGRIVATYTKEDSAITISGAVITVAGATFAATDTFVVGTNIPRPTASGAGGAGGGSIVYTNASGDFTATPTVGARTITITGLSFTLEAINVAAGTIKKITSAGVVTTLDLTDVAVSGGVITLDNIAVFASGDVVLCTFIGPDKAYDRTLDISKVVVQNPEYAHTTSVENLIDEANIAGATAASDAGGDATHIVDADGAFSVASVAVGYEARNVTESATVTVISLDSTTQLTTDAVTSWSGDTYRLPLVKRYEVNMDTYKALTAHYRLTNDANCTAFLKLYATNDASATVDADTNWVDVSTTYLASASGWSAGDTAIKRAASGTTEGIVTIAPAGPYLKFMFKLVVECTIATAPANAFKLFTKKF